MKYILKLTYPSTDIYRLKSAFGGGGRCSVFFIFKCFLAHRWFIKMNHVGINNIHALLCNNILCTTVAHYTHYEMHSTWYLSCMVNVRTRLKLIWRVYQTLLGAFVSLYLSLSLYFFCVFQWKSYIFMASVFCEFHRYI